MTTFEGMPPRAAWIEIDLEQLRRNFGLIRAVAPRLEILSVVKAGAYGHGSVPVAQVALAGGADMLGVATLGEAAVLRDAGITAPILLFGNHPPECFQGIRELDLIPALSDLDSTRALNQFARAGHWTPKVHLKVNTGMNRYGFRSEEVGNWLPRVRECEALRCTGVFSHFVMSDEADKSFAHEQRRRFQAVLDAMATANFAPGCRHLGNSGAFLDLPEAHYDRVRLGILPLGVYPSRVCRRLPGIEPVLSVKARIAALADLAAGETVGYGLKYVAPGPRRVAIVPVGYADGYPRLRNAGQALVHGQRAPLVGGVAMDALAVDVTEVPAVAMFDEVVLLGSQGGEEIRVEELAQLGQTVSYDILAGWRNRLPRVFRGGGAASKGVAR